MRGAAVKASSGHGYRWRRWLPRLLPEQGKYLAKLLGTGVGSERFPQARHQRHCPRPSSKAGACSQNILFRRLISRVCAAGAPGLGEQLCPTQDLSPGSALPVRKASGNVCFCRFSVRQPAQRVARQGNYPRPLPQNFQGGGERGICAQLQIIRKDGLPCRDEFFVFC